MYFGLGKAPQSEVNHGSQYLGELKTRAHIHGEHSHLGYTIRTLSNAVSAAGVRYFLFSFFFFPPWSTHWQTIYYYTAQVQSPQSKSPPLRPLIRSTGLGYRFRFATDDCSRLPIAAGRRCWFLRVSFAKPSFGHPVQAQQLRTPPTLVAPPCRHLLLRL